MSSPTGGADRGAVGRAFTAAVHAELNDYFRLIAVLESQSHLPPPEGAPAAGGDGDGSYLTLRRLDLWLAEPLQRMRLLAVLVDCTRGLRGARARGLLHDSSSRALRISLSSSAAALSGATESLICVSEV